MTYPVLTSSFISLLCGQSSCEGTSACSALGERNSWPTVHRSSCLCKDACNETNTLSPTNYENNFFRMTSMNSANIFLRSAPNQWRNWAILADTTLNLCLTKEYWQSWIVQLTTWHQTMIKLFPYNHPQFPPSNTRKGVMVWTQRGASCKCPCLVLAVLMLKLRTSCQHYRGIGNSPWSPAPRPPQYYGRLSSILSFPGVTLSGRR